jgi:predicted O-methyltransferase YrrM
MAGSRVSLDVGLEGYLDRLLAPDPEMAGLLAENADDPWAQMMTHPDLGRLLSILVRATGGRRVLEVGTFVGVSATWMARALAPGGRLDTIEVDPERADRAEAWFRRADLEDRITVHRGGGEAVLPTLPAGAYDLAYIDADKTGYPEYLEQAVRLVRTGGLVIADNVLSGGALGRPALEDSERVAALRAFTAAALAHPRLETTVLTVGDGVTLSAVR